MVVAFAAPRAGAAPAEAAEPATAGPPAVGEPAPPLELTGDDGQTYSIAGRGGEGPLLVVFYRGPW